MHRNYISISAHDNSEMLVVQFKPFGSFPFLHAATDLFNELIIPAHEVVGDSVYDLREQMANATDTEVVFALVEAWLLNRFEVSMAPTKPLLEIVTNLQDEPVNGLNAFDGSLSRQSEETNR